MQPSAKRPRTKDEFIKEKTKELIAICMDQERADGLSEWKKICKDTLKTDFKCAQSPGVTSVAKISKMAAEKMYEKV